MKNKDASEKIIAGCVIAAILLIVAAKCCAQNTLRIEQATPLPHITTRSIWNDTLINKPDPLPVSYIKHGNRRLPWNSATYFKDRPKPKALDWSTYANTWDGVQITTWGAFALGGIMRGCREAYHAQPDVFERRFGAGKTSWWGSEQWKRNYRDNDPEQPHKSEILGNFGRDMWHTFGGSDKMILISGSFIIGARKQPVKYRVANAVLAWAVHAAFSSVTYQTLR